jgi:hypothetical protein
VDDIWRQVRNDAILPRPLATVPHLDFYTGRHEGRNAGIFDL